MLKFLTTTLSREYRRGYRTPEPVPATPPRIGVPVGELVIFLKDEGEGVPVEEAAVPTGKGEASKPERRKKPKKQKKRKTHKRVVEEETPTVLVPEAEEPSEDITPLIRKRRKVVISSSGEKEAERPHPIPTPSATQMARSPVLVGKPIEAEVHTSNPIPPNLPEFTISSSEESIAGNPPSPLSQQSGRDISVHSPTDTPHMHEPTSVVGSPPERTTQEALEASVSGTHDEAGLEHLLSQCNPDFEFGSRPLSEVPVTRTSVDFMLLQEARGSEGSPRTANIRTTVEGVRGSLTHSEPFVGSEVPQSSFVTKEEFHSFATEVLLQLTELKSLVGSTPAPATQVHQPTDLFAETLKAHSEVLQTLISKIDAISSAPPTDLSETLAKMKEDIVVAAAEYAADVTSAGYKDYSEFKDEIKAMVQSSMVQAASTSTASGNLKHLATYHDINQLMKFFTEKVDELITDFNHQSSLARMQIITEVTNLKVADDRHILFLQQTSEDILTKVRKLVDSCSVQAASKRKRHEDDDSDDSDFPHEGEKKLPRFLGDWQAATSSKEKDQGAQTSEAEHFVDASEHLEPSESPSHPSHPVQHAPRVQITISSDSDSSKSSQPQPSSPQPSPTPIQPSDDPNSPTNIIANLLHDLGSLDDTPEEEDNEIVKQKQAALRASELKLQSTLRSIEEQRQRREEKEKAKATQTPQPPTQPPPKEPSPPKEPYPETHQTAATSSSPKDIAEAVPTSAHDEAGPSEPPTLPAVPEWPEDTHAYLFSEADEKVPFPINFYPQVSSDIRSRWLRTAQPKDRVFSSLDIESVISTSLKTFAHRHIYFCEYTVRRTDGRLYKFTDADLPNLCPYDLAHLHGFAERFRENRKELVHGAKNIKEVMRQLIRFYSQTDFEIGLQLGVEKLKISRPDENHPALQSWHRNSIITAPVYGLIYRDLQGHKRIFRVSESYKFSNLKLAWFFDKIQRHRGSRYMHPEVADKMVRELTGQSKFRDLIFTFRDVLKNSYFDPVNDFPVRNAPV